MKQRAHGAHTAEPQPRGMERVAWSLQNCNVALKDCEGRLERTRGLSPNEPGRNPDKGKLVSMLSVGKAAVLDLSEGRGTGAAQCAGLSRGPGIPH